MDMTSHCRIDTFSKYFFWGDIHWNVTDSALEFDEQFTSPASFKAEWLIIDFSNVYC